MNEHATTPLEVLHRHGLLDEIDRYFATHIATLDLEAGPVLALAAALVSQRTLAGDVCIDLADESLIKPYREILGDILPALPKWLKDLRQSPVVALPGDYRPLVLDETGRLYLYRYWALEQRVAAAIRARAENAPFVIDETTLASSLDNLFPADTPARDQRMAAMIATRRPLSIISGGPGTGKTATAIRILTLLQQLDSKRPLRVALTAPTGKAAARLRDALANADPSYEQLPFAELTETATLHRLLGFRANGRPAAGADQPLTHDVVLVDEASMVDLNLMATLLEALPEQTRLILLGDPDQLASVEAGAVLSDLCAGMVKPTKGRATDHNSAAPSLDSCVTVLRHNWRFSKSSGIGQLAAAINAGDADGALAYLDDAQMPDIVFRPCPNSATLTTLIEQHAISRFEPCLDPTVNHVSVADQFARHLELRLLTAHRQGPTGSGALNQQIEHGLRSRGLIRQTGPNYTGRPIMIERNDYHLGLYNGDFGIVLGEGDTQRVCVLGHDGTPRYFYPSRLPQNQTAFAMTVH
ncbi:MAG: exodeoxyribonuclease V subunit alpha, partial [Arenicellales bacterium]|nr:exodeoxyribonuclease V subunit alpha [Arenicellales bacterium]